MSDTFGDLYKRLVARDATLWPEGNVSGNRLGWLDSPNEMLAQAAELTSWAANVAEHRVILLGMGGSSLGPLVLASVLDTTDSPATRELVVCDTTDPTTIAKLDFTDAFVVVSSKSGTTLEPNVLMAYAETQVGDPKRFAIITDPDTPLADHARSKGYKLFENRPDIGGRYSVMSYFGIVPAALIGYDVASLCRRALDIDTNAAVGLGVEMAQAAQAGRDKVTIVVPEAFASFGWWVEQLIAESTGKSGTGCIPVPTTQPEDGPDRYRVELNMSQPPHLGAEFLRFEIAIAICGHVLGIDPFNEPNVAESKANTNQVLEHLPLPVVDERGPEGLISAIAAMVHEGDYVSLQAYIPFGSDGALEHLRRKVRDALDGMAVTAGYGPRFLHSTGQLHKGGPPSIVAVQLINHVHPDVAIPDKPYDFATLIEAQSIGDFQSLHAHERRVLRVKVGSLDAIS